MSRRFGAAQRDRVLALLSALLALGFIVASRAIEDSLLSDEVGAGGVPQATGIAMLVAAVALFAKSFIGAAPAAPTPMPASVPTATPAKPPADRRSFWLRTLGLVLILCGYTLLLPLVGYTLSISLLVLSAGALAGAALRWPLLLAAALAGPVMWVLFSLLLQVRMPAGSWWG